METRHHILPKSRDGSNHPDNIVMLERKYHQRLHTLLGNLLPHEQIFELLAVASTALQQKFRKALMELLSDFQNSYYKEHTLLNGVWR